ncbi:helicase associated domain-containing protein [uncultured Microscilla sp.]|uniref:helicase associated domain-containing protein n=1 Tax=uncultured Microscilla sp. TaxID=432653 RepID=UPI00261B3EE6|nr:helicase associated domain-containing protein [uncultured Microscilla sp.]
MEDKEWTYPFDKPYSWDWRDEHWYMRYLELKAYKKIHGDCRVPYNWSSNKSLGIWVSEQRVKREKMVSWRRELLDWLGFTWRIFKMPKRLSWQEMYNNLCDFKEKQGHCNVPAKDQLKYLGSWVSAQRGKYKKGLLSQRQINLLEQVGFEWSRANTNPLQERYINLWERRFNELKTFKSLYGHCHVGRSYENKQLAGWVASQRRGFKEKTLLPERREKLDALGFHWDGSKSREYAMKQRYDKQWLKNFALLQRFQQKNGHCVIPFNQKGLEALSWWVSSQRGAFRKNKLSSDQVKLLNSIGFDWDRRHKPGNRQAFIKKRWMMRYQHLVDFKNTYGNFRVPDNKEFAALRSWLFTQRLRFRRGQLAQHFIDLLEELDPAWKVPSTLSSK